MTFVVKNLLYPALPEIQTRSEHADRNNLNIIISRKVPLRELQTSFEFPIIFKLCASEPDHDRKKFSKFGYKNEESWYVGALEGREDVVGWSGVLSGGEYFNTSGQQPQLMQSFSRKNIADILAATNYDWRLILRSLQISDEIIPSTELTWPLVQQALGCVSIDIEQIIQERRISLLDNFEIFLTASKLENLSLAVFVEDRRTSAGRTIKSNYQAYSGNQIRVRDLARPATRKFILSFFQYQFSEYDQVMVIW